MKPTPLITLDNITVRLQDRPYLQNTSWQINSDEHWAILGPNGSGKTTFAKSLFGEIPIIIGHIVFHFAKEDKKSRFAIANKIGYVSPELHRDIIERENLKDDFREFSGNIHGFLGRLLSFDHLHQFHDHGRREKMHADELTPSFFRFKARSQFSD